MTAEAAELSSGTSNSEYYDSFRQTALATRREGVWREIAKSLPPNSQDPFLDIFRLHTQRGGLNLDENTLQKLADEYDVLRVNSKADPDPNKPDPALDHMLLIKSFLIWKKVYPAPPVEKRKKNLFGWKTKAGLIGGAALIGGATLLGSGIFTRSSANGKSEAGSTAVPNEILTPEGTVNLTYELLKPFVAEAFKNRSERAKNDPEYSHRVDQELNQYRLNFLLFGYGEEHGESYKDYGGSPSILSYDLKSGQIGVVHLSRDIRVPELERLFPKDEMDTQRVRSLYKKLGFKGMQSVTEDMTGLAIDYQLVLKDTVVRDAIDELADGSLTIDIPKSHETGSYRLDGKLQDPNGSFIPQGTQTMNTQELMRYILAEDKNPQGKKDERSYRKNEVLNELAKKAEVKSKGNPLFLFKIVRFIQNKISTKEILADFDTGLFNRSTQLINGLIGAAGKMLNGTNLEVVIPEVNKNQEVVFHDPYFGDGGVTRVHNIKDNPNPQREDRVEVIDEIKRNLLPAWMLIPDGGNPYAKDLVTDYWQSTRNMVKKKLTFEKP